MFYKNILETSPLFMFGIVSHFSGTLIYNSLLYNSFNTFFTALPIIWFATFDYEYDKAVFLRTPRLYRIGILNLHFNQFIFWRWIFYAIWQSSLILYLTFYTFRVTD